MQAPRIGRRLGDVQGNHVVVRVLPWKPAHPHVLLKGIRQRFARVIASRRAGSASIFPFRLGGQAVGLAFLLAEPLAEGHGLLPGHEHDGFVVFLRESQLAPQLLVLRIELLVLDVSHLGHAHEERSADRHLVQRPLVPVAVRRTHQEGPRLNGNQLHS